jgi:hypothetical protein
MLMTGVIFMAAAASGEYQSGDYEKQFQTFNHKQKIYGLGFKDIKTSAVYEIINIGL